MKEIISNFIGKKTTTMTSIRKLSRLYECLKEGKSVIIPYKKINIITGLRLTLKAEKVDYEETTIKKNDKIYSVFKGKSTVWQ